MEPTATKEIGPNHYAIAYPADFEESGHRPVGTQRVTVVLDSPEDGLAAQIRWLVKLVTGL